MPMASAAILHAARPDFDVAEEMDAALGDISGYRMAGTQVLVGPYLRGEKTAGGIIDLSMVREDALQGKICRILMIGPLAFTMEDVKRWGGRVPQVGDWVHSRPEDCHQFSLCGEGGRPSALVKDYPKYRAGWPCRLVYAADIYAIVDDPNMVV